MTIEGTYECPICGCATPHAHSDEQVAVWRLEENIRAACSYCRGESRIVSSDARRNSNGLYFHRGAGHSEACRAQHAQQQIWLLRDHPASCSCNCNACMFAEYEWSDGTGEHCRIKPCTAGKEGQ